MKDVAVPATIAFLAFAAMPAFAGPDSYEPTRAELAALPTPCQVKISPEGRRNQAQQTLWSNRLGADNWMHYHHYCHGLKFMNRAFASLDRPTKRGHLTAAVGEFNYVLRAWPADSPLRPDAERRKQLAQGMLGNR